MALLDVLKNKQRELCPFCFEYFLLGQTPFRCTSPMSRCAPEQDAVLLSQWGDNRNLGKVLPATGRFVRNICCAACNQESRKRLCPACHADLPSTMGDYRNVVFAVIGAKAAGKSHYIAVLIEQIKKRVGPALDLLIEAMNEDTIKRYREEFYGPVYRDGTVIKATMSGLANRDVRMPLVYSLTISGKGLFGRTTREAATMVFFDTAGEDLNDEDTMSSVNKYIYRSDGIILLVDPLQLGDVRARLGSTTALPLVNSETADILDRTTRLVLKGRVLKETDRIPIPIAVTFSKFDAVLPLIDPQFQLNAEPRHVGGFDGRDFRAINSEMMALLDSWGGQDLVHKVRTRYAAYGFFGLTALGCNPHTDSKIPRVQPRRVEDPFLWLLAQNKLIRTVES